MWFSIQGLLVLYSSKSDFPLVNEKKISVFNLKNIIPQAPYVGTSDFHQSLFSSWQGPQKQFMFYLENSLSHTHCHLLFFPSVLHTEHIISYVVCSVITINFFCHNSQTQGVKPQNINKQVISKGWKTVSIIWLSLSPIAEPHQRVRKAKCSLWISDGTSTHSVISGIPSILTISYFIWNIKS